MRDLIEMTYKCITSKTCYKCEYSRECLLCEILDVHTGNAPPIIDYPTPTQIIYTEGENNNEKKKIVKRRFLATENRNGKENLQIINKINNFLKDERVKEEELTEDLNNFKEVMDFAFKNEEFLDPYEVWTIFWQKKNLLENKE